jgi:hypothetical protein
MVRNNFTFGQSRRWHPLPDTNHRPFPVADPHAPGTTLTVRAGVDAPARIIPRQNWGFGRVSTHPHRAWRAEYGPRFQALGCSNAMPSMSSPPRAKNGTRSWDAEVSAIALPRVLERPVRMAFQPLAQAREGKGEGGREAAAI